MSNTEIKGLISFLSSCRSAFHCIDTTARELTALGYTELSEASAWDICAGGRYFVTRNSSSLIAFRIPADMTVKPFMVGSAHSDCPSFKIKTAPETEAAGKYTRISVEKYGGMLCAPWLDRPLSAAGRVTYLKNGAIVSGLVDLDRDLFFIPSVAIHMNRNANENASYNPATDMQPIFGGLSVKGKYKALLAEKLQCNEDDIISDDMYMYIRQQPSVWGGDNEFISAQGLDDRQCVYSLLRGFTDSTAADNIPVLSIFDNEEVGSSTKQGAASTFLYDVLLRINEALGGHHSDFVRAVTSGFMISADNAHAVHPNHPEYSDAVNKPCMNGGIVIKHNANQRYTTDSVSDAVFTQICKKANVPYQHYTNRADIPGGSTLGNISANQVAFKTVDIGLPQLSMHSCYETAGVLDTEYLISAMKVFYSSSISVDSSEQITVN